MVDPSQYSLEKQLSLEEYRCSISQIDAYDRDIAKYASAAHLQASTRTNRDAIEIDPVVASRMNDLAASTAFTDVGQVALKLKASSNSEYRLAYAAINGNPPPDPSGAPNGDSSTPQPSEPRDAIVGTWRTTIQPSDRHALVYFHNDGSVTNSYDGEKGSWYWVGGATFSWRFNVFTDQVHLITISEDGRTLESVSNSNWSAAKI